MLILNVHKVAFQRNILIEKLKLETCGTSNSMKTPKGFSQVADDGNMQ